jgi:hypothetical protein
MTPYTFAAVYKRLEGTFCLYLHGIEQCTKCSTLKMELAGYFYIVGVFQTGRVGNPEDHVFRKHSSQNFKSHTNVS